MQDSTRKALDASILFVCVFLVVKAVAATADAVLYYIHAHKSNSNILHGQKTCGPGSHSEALVRHGTASLAQAAYTAVGAVDPGRLAGYKVQNNVVANSTVDPAIVLVLVSVLAGCTVAFICGGAIWLSIGGIIYGR